MKWFLWEQPGVPEKSGSATGEDGTESRVRQDARDSVTVLAVNLDPPFLHGASGPTSLLHFFRQPLLLRLTDTDKSCDNGHRLPPAVRGRTNDIHAPTIAVLSGWCLFIQVASRWLCSRRRQRHILQRSEWTLPCEQLITGGNVFLLFHAVYREGHPEVREPWNQHVPRREMIPDAFS